MSSTSPARLPKAPGSPSKASRPIAGAADAASEIRAQALALGFDAVGFAPARIAERAREGLRAYLGKGYHGDMGWLEARAQERGDPLALWPEARTAVVVGLNYGPDHDPLEGLRERFTGNISVYARRRDYHDILKPKLKALARWLAESHGAAVKVFVDTAPVMEKPLAQAAGLGWQGKHTNLVSREHGSWLFLGVLLTDMDLAPEAMEQDHCGACTRCLDVCPTAAFPAPYQLEARRCISYLTIEHKGHIPRELRPLIGNRIFGCDDCLAVCPWNKFAHAASDARAAARDGLSGHPLDELARLDDPAFRKLFAGTPVRRAGRDRFVRNVLVAIGNSGDASLAEAARERLDDANPLVRAAAIWALRRLLDGEDFEKLTARAAEETDEEVRAEWLA